MIVLCPHCGEYLSVGKTTWSIICGSCRLYSNRKDWLEPTSEQLEKFDKKSKLTLISLRTDPMMQRERKMREKVARQCDERLKKARGEA